MLRLLKSQRIWRHLGWRDLRILYGRSRLGPLWSIATLATSVAGLVLAQGVLVGEINFGATAPRLTVALWIWFFFSSVITESTIVLDAERRTLLNSVIDESVFIVKVVWKHLTTMAISLPVVLLLLLTSRNSDLWGLLLLVPIVLAFSVALLLPISLIARWTVVWPDLKGIVPPTIQMLFFFSPIIWTPSPSIPISETIAEFNPIAWIVLTAQALTSTTSVRYSFIMHIVVFAVISITVYSLLIRQHSSIKERL